MYLQVKENAGGWTHIDLDTFYDIGGMNYFTSQVRRRGYYVSAQPVKKNGYTETREIFNGCKIFLQDAGRLNKKTLQALQEKTLENGRQILEKVLLENGLELVEAA